MAFEDFYNQNPVAVVDQNLWTDKIPEILMQFQTGATIYTPLIDWMDRSQQTGAQYSQWFEVLEGEPNVDEIAINAEYIPEPQGVDSRMRQLTVTRYGDKVQLHESENVFQMWKHSGGRDWRPLLRGVLGNNVKRKIEMLSRNAYLKSPRQFWTYGGTATNLSELDSTSTFGLDIVNAWNLRLGNLGSPVIPGTAASVKLAILPPGAIFDFFTSIANFGAGAKNETALWRDAFVYHGDGLLKYEIGSYKNTKFVEHPNDRYGMNNSILYNAGKVFDQYIVIQAINMGDGAPDPQTTAVDSTWFVGQKAATHYLQCNDDADFTNLTINDILTIHIKKSALNGDSDGVDFLDGKTINRRLVGIDDVNCRLSFDRPLMFNYKDSATLTPKSGDPETAYAYITRAQHVGFILTLGSRGGIMGNVNRPLRFYEPRPVDDFEAVWRYVWDIVAGYNIWEPHLFECHFVAVSLPKPGGVISPTTFS